MYRREEWFVCYSFRCTIDYSRYCMLASGWERIACHGGLLDWCSRSHEYAMLKWPLPRASTCLLGARALRTDIMLLFVAAVCRLGCIGSCSLVCCAIIARSQAGYPLARFLYVFLIPIDELTKKLRFLAIPVLHLLPLRQASYPLARIPICFFNSHRWIIEKAKVSCHYRPTHDTPP